MTSVTLPRPWPEQVRFAILLLFIGCCFLWGGASRLDVPGLIILQPLAVVVIAAALLVPGPVRFAGIRVPILLLAGLALIMVAQLVPLPPDLWRALPGHARFADLVAATGQDDVWRPISLTPDLTLASLTGLIVPLAALILAASIPPERCRKILPWLLGAVALSCLWGLAQVAGGPQSGFYRYSVTNLDAAVGFFSNRNHNAVLLAAAFPMLAIWMRAPTRHTRVHPLARRWVAIASAVFLIPMLLVTGSRGGLLLGFAGAAFAAWYLWRTRDLVAAVAPSGRFGRLVRFLPFVAAGIVVVAALLLARAEAITRIFGESLADDPRAHFTPLVFRITKDFMPFGSGFGSFDPVFRAYEPAEALRPLYFNHAHNDLLELAMTGGIPALLIILLFFIWFARIIALLIRARRGRGADFGFLAAAIIVSTLASSLVDYPLRTPLLAALFAICCAWLGGLEEPSEKRSPEM
jgi:O-antigen ligase